MLAQKEYKKRYDNVYRYIHWRLCDKHGFQGAQQWFEHEPDGVIDEKGYKILWDFTIQWDTKIKFDDQILLLSIKPRTKLGL